MNQLHIYSLVFDLSSWVVSDDIPQEWNILGTEVSDMVIVRQYKIKYEKPYCQLIDSKNL
jgi:hypothetical protein